MTGSRGRRWAGVALAGALTVGGCQMTDNGWPGHFYDFDNETGNVVSVVRETPGGSEITIASPIAPGASWSGRDDCAGGTYSARDGTGTEVAHQMVKSCLPGWIIANGPIRATIVNGLSWPLRVVVIPWSSPEFDVVNGLPPGAKTAVDISSLGDPNLLCHGHLLAYDGRQAAWVAEREVTTCSAWNWTVEPSPTPSASAAR